MEEVELETLQREVAAEITRRRSTEPAQKVAKDRPNKAVSPTKTETAEVPTGKANLIKASHLAGMKPAAIARSLRIPQSLVNRVLGAPQKPQK